jgi:osmotically-inducible protein OsmY
MRRPVVDRTFITRKTIRDGLREEAVTDAELQLDVAAELSWEPRVGSETITVSADDGVITVRGVVRTLREVREAERAVARVHGVTAIRNELRVLMPPDGLRDDGDLLGDVLGALMLDGLIPMSVDARVRDGFVTLTGTAQWHYQRDEAELLAASVPGVFGIDNAITLTSAPDGRDVMREIKEAFRRSAVLDAQRLRVSIAPGGTVILSGTVGSWAEHDAAVAAAWSAPGATGVDVQIVVTYQA